MQIDRNKKEEILACAKKMQHYNNLLIEQCNNWLSAEEGLKNLNKKHRKGGKRK
jgi:hypothetical protein